MQQSLLDKYIDEDVSFAIFKYPDCEDCTLIVGEEKILGHSYKDLDNISAFVFSPFDLSKHPIVSIIPHTVITQKLEISKYTQDKSIESQHVLVEDQLRYEKVFDVFYQSILSEGFSKLVLSRTAIYNTEKENLASELFQSATNISGAFVYLCHTPSIGTWLGATPELLLQGKENTWQTVALAGTRHRDTLTDWDEKNIKEQLYVTDYICQVLEQLNCRISLQNTETIQASGVEHLKTKISFSNESDTPLAMSELIESLHPTPAICGLPKKEAFNFINDNEGYDRSYYSGLVGWINPSEEIRLYVNLRCLKMNNSRSFQLFAGGGLVKSSNKEQEWSETKAKMHTLLSLLKNDNMYSTIKNVQYVIASLKAYNISKVVLSPGSRNAPLVHSLASDSFFDCTLVVDERSAAFTALGIIQRTQQTVAICCTSGSALLDYAPAVVEAYYQQLPLIVISADRPSAWINQMDGQTMVQANALANYVKKTVQLPEINNNTDAWFCERLLHDALLTATHKAKGPVHINVPISEPLFDFSATELPIVNAVRRSKIRSIDIAPYVDQWNKAKRIMIVVGQMAPSEDLNNLLDYFSSKFNCVILAEQLANVHIVGAIENFDIILHNHKSDDKHLAPDLLIYLGGHIVSKRLKHFLRKVNINKNWRISEDLNFVDLFQGITDSIECDPILFLQELASEGLQGQKKSSFKEEWQKASNEIIEPGSNKSLDYSDLSVVESFVHSIPKRSNVFIANSSVVRNMQLFHLDGSIQVYCNRGVNGIDGAISTALGIAQSTTELVFLLIGDLSFFYDIGALALTKLPSNLRILLLNNGGGAIFSQLPVPNKTPLFDQYIAAEHSMTAEHSIDKQRIDYSQVSNASQLDDIFATFVRQQDKPILLEVITDNEANTSILKNYYSNQK